MIREYNEAFAATDADGMEAVIDVLMGEGYTADEITKAAATQRGLDEDDPIEIFEPIEEDYWKDYGTEEGQFDVSFLTDAVMEGKSSSVTAATKELLDEGKTQKEIDGAVATELRKRMAKRMGYTGVSEMPDNVYFDESDEEYEILQDEYNWTQYSGADAAAALAAGRSSDYEKMKRDMIGRSSSIGGEAITATKFEDSLKDALRARLVKKAGYDTKKAMPDGVYFDTSSKEYQILHDTYGWTQYSYKDAALAYAGVYGLRYSAVKKDMEGRFSSGDKVYDTGSEKYKGEVRDNLMKLYKEGRYAGTATAEELSQYVAALSQFGWGYEMVKEKYREFVRRKEGE